MTKNMTKFLREKSLTGLRFAVAGAVESIIVNPQVSIVIVQVYVFADSSIEAANLKNIIDSGAAV